MGSPPWSGGRRERSGFSSIEWGEEGAEWVLLPGVEGGGSGVGSPP